MAKVIVALTAAELSALGAVDGTLTQSQMSAKIKTGFLDLNMIERREWLNGPFWRTARGDRRVLKGK